MAKKIVGYILFGLGLAGIAFSFPLIRDFLKLSLPGSISELNLMIAGIVLLLIGAFFAFGGKTGQHAAEVPIYRGKQIVGYRKA